MPLTFGSEVVFAHVPSTGGTSIAALLEGAGITSHAGVPHWASHARLADFRQRLEGRIVFATVRPPRDWYASRVGHSMLGPQQPNGILRLHWQGTMEATAAALAAPETAGLNLDWTPETRWWVPWEPGERPFRWCAERRCGLYTWLWARITMRREAWRLDIDELRARHDELSLLTHAVDLRHLSRGLRALRLPDGVEQLNASADRIRFRVAPKAARMMERRDVLLTQRFALAGRGKALHEIGGEDG